MDVILIRNLRSQCIIGEEPWEREIPQEVRVDLEFNTSIDRAGRSDDLRDTVDYATAAQAVLAYIRESRFRLLETLAEGIAQLCCTQFRVDAVTITLWKRSTLTGVDEFGIRCTRQRA